MSGSLLSLSHPMSPESPPVPDSPAGRGGVWAQPPPRERPAWRWAGVGPEGSEEGGGFREEEEEEEAEEGGACCWDLL